MKLRWTLPELTVFTLAAMLPTYLIRFHVGPVPMTVLETVELIAIVALLVTQPKNPGGALRAFARHKTLAVGSALLALAVIIGVIVAPDTTAALGIAKAYFVEPMVLAWLIIASNTVGTRLFRMLALGAAVSAAVIVLVGVVQLAHPSLIPAPWDAERRITSVYDFPNAVALFLAPVTSLLSFAPVGAAFVVGALIAIALAHSAGGLVAASVALVCFGLMQRPWRKKTILCALAAVVLAVGALALPALRSQIVQKQWSLKVRTIGYHEAIAMLRDHPLAGAGLSGFPTTVAPYHTAQGVEIFQYPHNFALAIWSELGVLGLAAFALIIGWFLRAAWKKRMIQSAALGAAIIAMLVHGIVDVPYFKNDLAMLFWLLVAIMALL